MKNINNKAIIEKYSKNKYQVSNKHRNDLVSMLQQVALINWNVEQNLKINSSIFIRTLLNREVVASSRIEGTHAGIEDPYYFEDMEIDNVYDWETNNLIKLYKNTFKEMNNKDFNLNIPQIKHMHKGLYAEAKGIKDTFKAIRVIQKNRPGYIISKGDPQNWIGGAEGGIEKATMISITPENKLDYLQDLLSALNDPDVDMAKLIISFHPIFEAIHPFADGNGRLGRVLMTIMFKYLGVSNHNILFCSDIIDEDRETYKNILRETQITGDLNLWADYFIKILQKVVSKRTNQFTIIINLYKEFNTDLKATETYILKKFFTYPILMKKKIIKGLIKNFVISSATAYRAFDKVSNLIGATEKGGYSYFGKLFSELS